LTTGLQGGDMNNDNIENMFIAWLADRLDASGQAFFENARAEIATGAADSRFCQLVALASRHVRRRPLAPTEAERREAAELVPGWDPADWTLLETLRVALILARRDLAQPSFADTFENFFRYADEGESCAFYRALPLLPHGERFVWRAGEGCRTNMTSVFRAIACDSPFPVTHLDEIAWQQMLMKALFVGVPLWRVDGLDRRLNETLAVMFLDYVDERTSAGRSIPADGWLLLGSHWSDRAARAVDAALDSDATGSSAAAIALARAGQKTRLTQWLARSVTPITRKQADQLLAGIPASLDFPHLLAESTDYAVL
jgi:hypothetical protein